MPSKKTKTRSFSLPTDTMDKLVEDADKNRRSVSNQLAVIVEDYFEAQEKAGDPQ